MDTMLNKIADFYDDEVDTAIGTTMSLLQPALMGFLAVVLGGLVISMYFPVINLAVISGRPGGTSGQTEARFRPSLCNFGFSASCRYSPLSGRRPGAISHVDTVFRIRHSLCHRCHYLFHRDCRWTFGIPF